MSLNVNPGFPMPTEAQAAAAAPGTLFVPLLDFSPAEGESWRSPRLLNAKVYVNAPEGASWHWGDGGFYQIEKAGPAKWLLRVSDEPAERIVRLPASLLGTYKTRQAALDAAATHLRERAEAAMTAINKTDQAYAESNAALDRVVTSIRESLERKRQRHGEKFDQAQAMTDYLRRVNKMPATVKTILLATALQRLATDEDPFAEIADLDFEINVKNINDPEEDPS